MPYAAAASLTITGLSTLANGSFATSNAITNAGLDTEVEVVCTVGTVAGNKQYIVYAMSSLDATNYSDTQEANLRMLGIVATPSNATAYRSPAFSLAAAFGGTCPANTKVVVKNDSGATLTAGTAQTVQVT